MGKKADMEHTTACEPLLELASPAVYRRNLFRVLGLPITATAKDVQREQNRRRMQEKLGIAAANGSRGPLDLDPPPTEEDIRGAMERLNRPIDRLLDEIFWFWPTNGDSADDPALEALQQGDVKEAADIWMGLARDTRDGHIATHNLAVLDHLVALDHEARLVTSGLSPKDQKSLADLWVRGFARWKRVFEAEDFWDTVRDRVRNLNDIQLTTGFVRRVRASLPTALLLINAKIACAAAERSDRTVAQHHIELLRQADFGDGLADQAIREAIRPVRTRIKTATENARSRWARTPQHGNRYVRELHDHAKQLLAVVDAILPEEDPTRSGLHDMVAEAMLEGQVAFGFKTNDWQECIELLRLAQALAVGEVVRSRLSENTDILNRNAEAANDWCSPGYWELPKDTIELLEAARELAAAGNCDRAINALVVLDPGIGGPLRRCLACCLSQRAAQIVNEGFEEFNRPTRRIQEFLNTLSRLGSVPVPNPYMQAYMLPACPCCGRRSYTSWANGTYNGQQFWMCSTCSEQDDLERQKRKSQLGTVISASLEYATLAKEVDPDDPGVRSNLESLKELGKRFGASVPNTKALRKRLGSEKIRGVRQTFELADTSHVCCFCGLNDAEDSCRITVPMCGDVRPVRLLFNDGLEYRYADVLVPRCRRCRDEHRELPDRIEKWHEARLATADDERFPEEAQECCAARQAASDAASVVEQCKHSAAEAQEAVDQAERIGHECGQCGSADYWDDGLCQRCDGRVYRLGTLSKLGAMAAAIAALVGVLIIQRNPDSLSVLAEFVAAHTKWPVGRASYFAPVIASGVIPLVFFVMLIAGLKQVQWKRRRGLRKRRQAEFPQRRRAAIAEAQERLDRATSELKAAEQAAREPRMACDAAEKKLQAAKARALAEFERVYPEPRLATGIKPESAYLEFSDIRKLRQRGWGFGHTVQADGTPATTCPCDVKGLVSRQPQVPEPLVQDRDEPREGADTTGAAAAKTTSSTSAEIECNACGQRFSGSLKPDGTCPLCGQLPRPSSPSTGPKAARKNPPPRRMPAGAVVLILLVLIGGGLAGLHSWEGYQTDQRAARSAKMQADFERRNLRTAHLERNDGFGAKLDALDAAFRAAQGAFDQERWPQAEANYEELANECWRLLRLDSDRQAARRARTELTGMLSKVPAPLFNEVAREAESVRRAAAETITAAIEAGDFATAQVLTREHTTRLAQILQQHADAAATAESARSAWQAAQERRPSKLCATGMSQQQAAQAENAASDANRDYLAGRYRAASEAWQAAARALTGAVDAHEKALNDLSEQAVSAMRAQRFADAEESLEELADYRDVKKERIDLFLTWAKARISQETRDEAREATNKLLALDPQHSAAPELRRQINALFPAPVYTGWPSNASEPRRDVFTDQWYVILFDGKKAGHANTRREHLASPEGNLVRTVTNMRMTISRDNTTISFAQEQETLETFEGVPRSFATMMTLNEQTIMIEGTIANGKISVTTSKSGQKSQPQVVDWPAGALMPWGCYREQCARGFEADTRYEVLAFNPGNPANAFPLTIEVLGKEVVDYLGGKVEAVRIREGPQETWMTPEGTVVRTKGIVVDIPFEMVACSQAVAAGPDDSFDISGWSSIPLNRAIDTGSAQSITYRIRLKGDSHARIPAFPQVGAQRTYVVDDQEVLLTVTRASKVVGEIHGQLTEEQRQHYLSPSAMVDFEDSAVQRLLPMITGDREDPIAFAHEASKFVGKHLKNLGFGLGVATASEVASSREGGPVEYCTLLTALGRAKGIPARAVVGLACRKETGDQPSVLEIHTWTQFWINGQWIDLDPILDQHIGVDPTHLVYATDTGDGTTIPDKCFSLIADVRSLVIDVVKIDE